MREGTLRNARSIMLAAFAAMLIGCAPQQFETNWSKLQPGMTHQEVETLLGKPSSTFVPQQPSSDPNESARARSRASERWQYGDTLSSLGTRAVFPEEPDERTWCVFFGRDGRVSSFERPLRPR